MRPRSPATTSLVLISMLATAVHAVSTLPVRSTFDAGDEGWTYPVSAEWRGSGGNPGGLLYGALDSDPNNITPVADAPATFLGNWSSLDGLIALTFDYRKFSHGGGTIVGYFPLTVSLAGPGGAATWTGMTPTEPTDWFAVVAPVAAANWSVSSGSWSSLLQNVTQLRIQIELESSTESPDDKAGIDNITLTLLGDANLNGRIDSDDFALTDRGLAMHLTGWSNGDFNGDQTVNQQDVLILDRAFAHQESTAPVLNVPEPTVAAILVVCPLLRQRRRQSLV